MVGFTGVRRLVPFVQKARSFYNCTTLCQNGVPATTETKDIALNLDLDEPKKISKAMKSYMERAKAHDSFIKQQLQEYNIGKRHLANMMGKDPEFFTQKDIDEAIRYLFPSGLFDPRARPVMKHPDELYPKQKAAEFDENGRPHHTLFYTSKPNYYKCMQDLALKFKQLDRHEDQMLARGHIGVKGDNSFMLGSDWLPVDKVEGLFLETINEKRYTSLINALERLSQHPYATLEKDFIMKFRKEMMVQTELQTIPKLLLNESGRPYTTYDARRKLANASVMVIGQGTGLVNINGKDIHYFETKQGKEQVLFPLQFTDLLGKVDIVATVSGGGVSGQSGAIRHGLSMCLRSFVDSDTIERMRIAGLLSFDPRHRERKKPGQEGARRKFTWKRR